MATGSKLMQIQMKKKYAQVLDKWTEDGEYKVIRSKCITQKEYQTSLNAPDYLV